MDKDTLIEKLDEKIDRISPLRGKPRFSPEYKKWFRETRILLERAFGEKSHQLRDFTNIQFIYRGAYVVGDQEPHDRKFLKGLEDSNAILTSIKEEIFEYGLDTEKGFSQNPISLIEIVLKKFHTVVKQMRRRYNDRPTIDIEDEYDVQDLLHSLLKIFFNDIRAEEWAPSYAGSSSRMDFLLKEEKIVIETKMTRKSMKDKDLVDQLIVDIDRYQAHPDCETLICFIYDPEERIVNRQSIITDLSNSKLNLKIMVSPEE